MKLSGILILTLGAAAGWAQQVDANIVTPAPFAFAGTSAYQVITSPNNVVIMSGSTVKGRPFSATEENRSLQVLGNGARIENNSTAKRYRDAEGRTRLEDAQGRIIIVDPVAGFRATLDPKAKTATKSKASGGSAFGNPSINVRTTRPNNTGSELREFLGVQSVNGANARGERLTITIPKGEIGNDRELKVITERWLSEELGMLIKSTNSDPRYGDTTYELTNIKLTAPDPALFQIPADYAVTEAGGPRPIQARPAAKAKAGGQN